MPFIVLFLSFFFVSKLINNLVITKPNKKSAKMRKINYFPVRNSNHNLIINKYLYNKYLNKHINKSLKNLTN